MDISSTLTQTSGVTRIDGNLVVTACDGTILGASGGVRPLRFRVHRETRCIGVIEA